MSFVVPSFSLEFNLKCSFDTIFQDYHFETRHKVEAFSIEKTNKLSFKCWEESGPKPGVAVGHRVDINRNRKLFGDSTCMYVWKPAIGWKLHPEQEADNSVNKFAMKVVKNNKTVGHLPREYSWILWYFIAGCGKICLAVTGCRRLVVWVKRKLMAWTFGEQDSLINTQRLL